MCSIMGWLGESADWDIFQTALARTISRGPDATRTVDTGCGLLGFNRLSIMGLTDTGMQPFELNGCYVVCNGEIYGFGALRADLEQKGYTFSSDSDCEILLPMYFEYGTDMFRMLDAEFVCIIYDGRTGEYIAARDPIGIRPMFYGLDSEGVPVLASEAKNLTGLCEHIMPFPPGCFSRIPGSRKTKTDSLSFGTKPGGADITLTFEKYCDITHVSRVCTDDLERVCANIHDKLTEGVRKRLIADAKVGFLLSGGLDSSLVCAIAARESSQPVRTFAIGMDIDAIDLKYARIVSDYIGSEHTEVIISRDDVIAALEPVIALLGTYDITTIRASIGMYLVCKAIHEQTDIRVILTGEISDELFGYKYTDFAPSAAAFQEEAVKRIKELYMYDVLRADRCISVNSLEARVPFGDLDFVKYVMSIDPEKKLNSYGKGKYLLRHAFEGDLLPDEILWREKAAFSDAVGHSMVDDLKEYAENFYSEQEFEEKRQQYTHAQPFTRESLLYREIFEKYYPGQVEMITDFWMPNRDWDGCNVTDPSARVLSNYGDSGK